MGILFVILLLPFPSLEIGELNIDTDGGNSYQLGGFYSHEQFYTALSNQIEIKVRNATLASLIYSEQDINALLSQIDYIEYTFLQIFHSLTTDDVTYTNQLTNIYSQLSSGRQLQLSDYFKSSITFPAEMTYKAMNAMVNSSHYGLKPIPNDVITAILSVTNTSKVFEKASRFANIEVMQWLLQYVSETERYSALETAWRQQNNDVVRMLINSNITSLKPTIIKSMNKEGESILHFAVKSNAPLFVGILLQSGAEVNTVDKGGASPLLEAVKNDDVVTAKMLIENKADVDASTKSGITPLHAAARNGNLEMVMLLLVSGSTVHKETAQGVTPALMSEIYTFIGTLVYLRDVMEIQDLHKYFRFFYFMTSYEDIDPNMGTRKTDLDSILEYSKIVAELLSRGEKSYIPEDIKSNVTSLVMELKITELALTMFNIGARLDPKEIGTKSIFVEAIESNNYELTAHMLDKGMSVNTEIIEGNGVSPLELAARHGRVAIFNLLIKKGGDVKKIPNEPSNVLHAACEGGKVAIVRHILNAGLSVDSADFLGSAPLFYAAWSGHSNLVKFLIDHGANVTARNRLLNTALHMAAYSEDVGPINILIEAGAEIDARNDLGDTPLCLAAGSGNDAAVVTLLKGGAAKESAKYGPSNPLIRAIESGHLNTTRLLLDSGMRLYPDDPLIWPTLQEAASRGDVEILKLLLEKEALIGDQYRKKLNSLI